MEIFLAVTILSLAASVLAVGVVARARTSETQEITRSVREAATNAIGKAETVNCAGWGLWGYDTDFPMSTGTDDTFPRTESMIADVMHTSLHYIEDCSVYSLPNSPSPHEPCDYSQPKSTPEIWCHSQGNVNTADTSFSDLIGVHWRILSSGEWSPIVVGVTDYYQIGDDRHSLPTTNTKKCTVNPNDSIRPVRRIVAAGRKGGLPSGLLGSSALKPDEQTRIIADSMNTEDDQWIVYTLYVDGPALPRTAGWVVKQGNNFHWENAIKWKPFAANLADRYQLQYHDQLDASHKDINIRVQGRTDPRRTDPRSPICNVLAVPAGCVEIANVWVAVPPREIIDVSSPPKLTAEECDYDNVQLQPQKTDLDMQLGSERLVAYHNVADPNTRSSVPPENKVIRPTCPQNGDLRLELYKQFEVVC